MYKNTFPSVQGLKNYQPAKGLKKKEHKVIEIYTWISGKRIKIIFGKKEKYW